MTTTPVAAEAGRDEYVDEGLAIAQQRHSEGKRAERRLGLLLCAPAAIIMIVVTAYPILYAFWLSLNRADLRTPDANKFIWQVWKAGYATDPNYYTKITTLMASYKLYQYDIWK